MFFYHFIIIITNKFCKIRSLRILYYMSESSLFPKNCDESPPGNNADSNNAVTMREEQQVRYKSCPVLVQLYISLHFVLCFINTHADKTVSFGTYLYVSSAHSLMPMYQSRRAASF